MSSITTIQPSLKLPQLQELTGKLHQVLEIDELINLFNVELSNTLNYQGLRYQNVALGVDLFLDDHALNTCSYQLTADGRKLGELRLFRQAKFLPRELELIENHIGALIYPLKNAVKYQDAILSAFIDPLTGVKNRAALDNALEREVELSHRQGAAVSVILFDIDFFKKINDRLGHAAGDLVLRTVAQTAENSIRCSDILFRFGGEEFLILLSYTEEEGAKKLAERVRHDISKLTVTPDSVAPITVSLGVASLKQGESADDLFNRADAACYQAKEAGRNRVVCG